MSSLVMDEHWLMVNPWLAKQIGLHEALFVQQLRFWMNQGMGYVDEEGRRWIYNSIEDWMKQFPFISSVSTFKRMLRALKETHRILLTTTQFNRVQVDRTLAYTINEERLAELDAQYQQEKAMARKPSVKKAAAPAKTVEPSANPAKGQTKSTIVSKWNSADNQGSEDFSYNKIRESQPKGQSEPTMVSKRDCPSGQNDTFHSVKMTPWKSIANPPSGQGLAVSPRARVYNTTTNTTEFNKTTTTQLDEKRDRDASQAEVTGFSSVGSLLSSALPQPASPAAQSQGETRPVVVPLETLLSVGEKQGVPADSIRKCVKRFGEQRVQAMLEMLKQAKKSHTIQNAAGWLYTALKENFEQSPQQRQKCERDKALQVRREHTMQAIREEKQAMADMPLDASSPFYQLMMRHKHGTASRDAPGEGL